MSVTVVDGREVLGRVGAEAVRRIVTDGFRGGGDLFGAWDGLLPEHRDDFIAQWTQIVDAVVSHNALSPEDVAMMQALYSRSPALIETHLEKVLTVGADKFMSTYYVGYGHRSIGDCGTTTIFIEGVPMLAAKAIQDWPLYSGQEASTRYMDFSNAKISNPLGTSEGAEIQSRWMGFYYSARPLMLDHLHALYPRLASDKENEYERAINARCFDVLRAFLPSGTATNLSWHTNLRQARDHLLRLVQHPDRTVREIATEVGDALKAKYPASFRTFDDPTVNAWTMKTAAAHAYHDQGGGEGVSWSDTIDSVRLRAYDELIMTRPPRAELPHFLSALGQIETRFLLDFGSFRDLQRHRNGVVRMPLLTTKFGFHPWYLAQMPDELRERATRVIKYQERDINQLAADAAERQHYIPMGYRVSCQVTQSLSAFVYRIELRTGQSIHPTLRSVVQDETREFMRRFPGFPVYADLSPDTWDTRRGRQTITEVER
jgi:thymidylate synthase ThyX